MALHKESVTDRLWPH